MSALQLAERAERASSFFRARAEHPGFTALQVFRYFVLGEGAGDGLTFEQFVCSITTGHRWSYSGTAYGGDDERWGGEGRCLCSNCGADGDA